MNTLTKCKHIVKEKKSCHGTFKWLELLTLFQRQELGLSIGYPLPEQLTWRSTKVFQING